MVSTLKENSCGGFYCMECRMSVAEPVETCPFCGSIITNWMDIIVKKENEKFQAELDKIKEAKENENNFCRRN